MITTSAPGKLFIAGEYAVVEPGEPSVLIAVDRRITVRLTEGEGAGSVHSHDYGNQPLRWTRDGDGLAIERREHPYDLVLAAIGLVERLRLEMGVSPRFSDLRITSELDDDDGRKFGLGSSAAVTVATVAALDEFYGLSLTAMQRYRLAMLATISLSPNASGGDIAASTFGGWIGYRSPDRAALVERMRDHDVASLLDDAWPGLDVTRLPAPSTLGLIVGWTGEPASTGRLVERVLEARDAGRIDHQGFLADSRAAVSELGDALTADDEPRALDAVRRARRILRRLGDDAGVDIETDRLGRLCDAAEQAGGAAKPSGAGGGDCGIVLAPPDADLARMHRRWEAFDVRHLTITSAAAEGSIDD